MYRGFCHKLILKVAEYPMALGVSHDVRWPPVIEGEPGIEDKLSSEANCPSSMPPNAHPNTCSAGERF